MGALSSERAFGVFCIMGTMTDIAVAHQTDQSRFVLTVAGEEAGVCEYVDTADARDFTHTEIYPAYRGQGLSIPLIQAALDECREHGIAVKTSCSAVAGFIDKHPDYVALLSE